MAAHDECAGDKCGYRRLYEGSQVSLSDMAARQGAALGRVGRLRGAASTVLRRNFPDLASRAEQQLGARLSDVDDEILIAYLEAFVSNSVSARSLPPTQALRAALGARGVFVHGDDMNLWVAQLGDAQTHQEPKGAAHESASNDAAEQPHRPALLHVGAVPQEPDTAGEPVDRSLVATQSSELSGKTDTSNPSSGSNLGSIFADAAGVTLWNGPLGGSSAVENSWSPSPVAPTVAEEAWEQQETAKTARKRRKADTPKSKHESKSPSAAQVDKSEDGNELTKPAATSGTPASSVQETGDGSAAAVAQSIVPRQPETPDGEPPGLAPSAQPTGQDLEAPGEEDEVTRAADEPLVAPRESASQLLDSRPVQQAASLKPELVAQPQAKRKRPPKQLRLQAEAPAEAPLPAVAVSAPLVLDAGTKEALMAAASIPRPVFIRDLVGITGDPSVVEAWERECRADPANHPVRFISPKVRHRSRGSLVFGESSKAASASPDTWWGKCISTYRGARLYELAVLLHRVGDQLISHKFEENAALFRLSTDKGLNGVLVTFDTQLGTGEPTRGALAQGLSELLEERLVLITILTTSAEPGSLETLIATVEDVAREHHYKPVAPIVAARSWEYADDRGSTSLLVLGGA